MSLPRLACDSDIRIALEQVSTDTLDNHSGCSAAWLARLSGGQEVVGSNPASPTNRFRRGSGQRSCE